MGNKIGRAGYIQIRWSECKGGRSNKEESGGTRGEIRGGLMEIVSELEPVSSSVMPSALEEMGERMSTSALERMATLLSHRIVRVVSVIEPLS